MVDFVVFVAILSALLLGHELGHFFAAKAGGVEVEELGFGFPPRMLTLFEFRGTKYTLNWLPFGGFIRPKGENDPAVPGGLAGASKGVRAAVLLAGPAANIFLAFVAFTAAYALAAPDPERVMVTEVAAASPAAEAGLQVGDIIEAVDGAPIQSFDQLQEVVGAHLGQTIRLGIDRDGQSLQVNLVPRAEPPPNEGAIGILLGHPRRILGPVESIQLGWQSTQLQVVEILRLPARLIEGDVAPEQARVSGFKGMYDMLAWAGEIDRNAERPFLTLNLVGVISAGLAIANLLPIPALDGGRLMFVAFELVFRRRIAPEKEGLAHLIGFALLLLLMVYINFQDFVNPISLPR
ncbi:MAG TPA: M50 family metallopeptidase [Anaerolineales bacterium]